MADLQTSKVDDPPMGPSITASTLYDLVQCPKRVDLDLFGKASERDEVSPFVAMLWRRGTLYEKLSGIGMICLLILNCILLISKSQKQAFTQQQQAN